MMGKGGPAGMLGSLMGGGAPGGMKQKAMAMAKQKAMAMAKKKFGGNVPTSMAAAKTMAKKKSHGNGKEKIWFIFWRRWK